MITKTQISALKFMVFNCSQVDDLTKRIIVTLIDNSNGLRRGVRLTLEHRRDGYFESQIMDAASCMHNMLSLNGTFHLNEIVAATGSPLSFCYHNGSFGDPHRHRGPGRVGAYTFWLERHNRKAFSRRVRLVRVTKEGLEGINITDSGLYPHLKK